MRHVARLQARANEFGEKLCQVVLLCRTTRDAGCKWRKLTGTTFPVMADDDLNFVRKLGFHRSQWNIKRIENLSDIAQYFLEGNQMKSIEDDKLGMWNFFLL